MKVTFVMRADGNLLRGGAEEYADRTKRELEKLGVEVEVLTPLTRELGDVVNFFGGYDSHWSTANIALQRGIPYVCTPIYSSYRTESQERLRALRQKATGRFPRLQSKLFRNASALIVPTEREKRRLQASFGLDGERFRKVAIGVDERFADTDARPFRETYDLKGPFVLHVGAYSTTKNQLGLIRAMKGALPVVCIGHDMDPDYKRQCEREASSEDRILGRFDHESEILASAYAAASVFCVPSYNETWLMAAMEAAVAGCPLVLGNRWEAEEIYGDRAKYVNPDDPPAIRKAVMGLDGTPRQAEAGRELLARYSWPRVTADLLNVYRQVVSAEGV